MISIRSDQRLLDATHRGKLRVRRTALKIASLRAERAGEAILHDTLHRCEANGLVRSTRDTFGRRYELTAAGRARLQTEHRHRLVIGRLLLRGQLVS